MEQYRHAYPDALRFAVVNELHPLGQNPVSARNAHPVRADAAPSTRVIGPHGESP